MFELIESQRQGVSRMLELDQQQQQQQWKVLVYDKAGQEVIAPLLKVGALRNLGVTLHLALHAEREAVPEVPVVYFVEPSEENLVRIARDVEASLYESVHLNFTTAISRTALEAFAKRLTPPVKIAKVIDRFNAFVSLSDSSYSLNLPACYQRLHTPQSSDAAIGTLTDRIAEGIFCLVLACKNIPIVRCSAGGASELVARKVSAKIRDFIISTGPAAAQLLAPSPASLGGSAQRPLLILCDRDVDLPGMLNHTWTYQALLHDVLGLRGGRVRADGKDFDIDPSGDAFFEKFAAAPFPEVATAVNEQVADFTKKQASVSDEKSGGLSAAVQAMPALTEAKRKIDLHTSLATSLLNEIGKRRLDRYFEFESEMGKKSINSSLNEISELAKTGTATDQARAIFNFVFAKSKDLNQSQLDSLTRQLQTSSEDLSPGIKYVRYLASLRSMADVASNAGASTAKETPEAGFVKGLISVGMQNIKNILPTKEEMPLTRQVEAAMEQSAGSEKLLYLDPKASASVDAESGPKFRGVFRSAIVCVVGGGNYVEAQNVQAYAARTGKEIVYGATDFVSPSDFARELAALGKSL